MKRYLDLATFGEVRENRLEVLRGQRNFSVIFGVMTLGLCGAMIWNAFGTKSKELQTAYDLVKEHQKLLVNEERVLRENQQALAKTQRALQSLQKNMQP